MFEKIIKNLLALPRNAKRLMAVGLDASLCVITVWLAFYLRLGDWTALSGNEFICVAVSMIAIPIFIISGMYRAVFRFINSSYLIVISQAIFAYGVIYFAIFTAIGVPGIPRGIGVIQPVLLLLGVIGLRVLTRYFLGGEYQKILRNHLKSKVIVYGAGMTGRQLAVAMRDSGEMRIVAFVDDAKDLHGSIINGVRVRNPAELASLIEDLEVSEIILAIPSASRDRRNKILADLQLLNVNVRTVPHILDLAHGRVTISDLQPLQVDDLLGRNPVPPDKALLEKTVHGKVVLITGAGGSIGSEICRQICALEPASLVLVDNSEFALYAIHRELSKILAESATNIIPILSSVCDEVRMRKIFETWRPQTVYHAAAYKHVPLVEQNVIEGVRNNVLGTLICSKLSGEYKAERFVLVSTDKAVRPTNVMGASKRASELILQASAVEMPDTLFSMVRFGNVLGSSGSVVPLFRQQIAAGGPVTVTHEEVTRYFMTIPEAAQLVLQAAAMSQGGEVYVLDMGEPVKIIDLARRIIELSGLRVRSASEPDGDVDIEITGLRPGEKLYEELLIGESPSTTSHPRIMMASESFLPFDRLMEEIADLQRMLLAQNSSDVREWLRRIVPEYKASAEIVDWLFGGSPEDAARNIHAG